MSWQTVIDSGLLDSGLSPSQEQIEAAGLSDEDLQLLLKWFSRLTSDTPVVALDVGTLRQARRAGVVQLDFNPDQPRDESGKWTSGGGSGSGRDEAYPPMGGDYPSGTPGTQLFDDITMSRAERITAFRKLPGNEAQYQSAQQKLESVLQAMPDVHENVQLDVIQKGGAYFNQQTGEIGVDVNFTNYAREGRLRSIIEHELSHERLHRATANEATAKELNDFVIANGRAVVEEGRSISDYARAYWKRTERAYSEHGYDVAGPKLEWMKAQAINESLAEMHRRGRVTPTYRAIDKILARAPLGKALLMRALFDEPALGEWPLVFYLDAAGDPVESQADAALVYTFERDGSFRITPGPKFDG